MFGSCSINFSLKESDIDLLLVSESGGFSLKFIYQWLIMKQWVSSCKIIQNTAVPIIKFKVNLNNSPLAQELLSSKLLKKMPNHSFEVDLIFENSLA